MILLPLFWDQYDNAQRMDELGFGRRLSTYTFSEEEMNSALEDLLGDSELTQRMAVMAAGIQSREGTTKGADVIESVARAHATS
jgi:UDP:flavonoid glycosyltransferase YjiC (YdhE family)